jgi:hypothetical protein
MQRCREGLSLWQEQVLFYTRWRLASIARVAMWQQLLICYDR